MVYTVNKTFKRITSEILFNYDKMEKNLIRLIRK